MTRSVRHRIFSAGSCTGKYTSPAEKIRFFRLRPFIKRAGQPFFHREPSQRSEAEVAWFFSRSHKAKRELGAQHRQAYCGQCQDPEHKMVHDFLCAANANVTTTIVVL